MNLLVSAVCQSKQLALTVFLLLIPSVCSSVLHAQSDLREAALTQVTADIEYLASDELGGRKPGTPGMDKAEAYLLKEYKKIGLKPYDGESYIQEFTVAGETNIQIVDDSCAMTLTVGDQVLELEQGSQFVPQYGRFDYKADSGLVFVGYGVKAKEHSYDEYANVNVNGKIVVILRHEPQSDDEESVFNGTEYTKHAFIRTKISIARRAGAVGVLFVNDHTAAPNEEQDELPEPGELGRQFIPFATVKRSVINQLLESSPLLTGEGEELNNLTAIEENIDENLSPLSQTLTDCNCKFDCKFEKINEGIIANNLIGVIEGEGPLANETIIIGGHHDHLGMGGAGSRAGGRHEIHNGADDNATGTAAVLELARRFAAKFKDNPPKRRLVFICFSAEEMGLLGAKYYVDNPVFPLENTMAMINYDMIGWLRDKELTVYNWNSSPIFAPILEAANADFDLNLNFPERSFAGSDHLPFHKRGIPVMFFHTGLTTTYHTPEDDFDTIDCDGALTVIEYCEGVVDRLCDLNTFSGKKRLKLGIKFNFDNAEGGTVQAIWPGSIADQAGFQEGDLITEFGGAKLKKRSDVTKIIRENAGDVVGVRYTRDGEELSMKIALVPPEADEEIEEVEKGE